MNATLETPTASTSATEKTAVSRVLVVDDSVVNQRLSVALLKQRGYEVQAVGDGREAVRLLCDEAQKYDVVLMDCHMPEMDGFEATAKIREHDGPNRAIVIIALTGTLQETQMFRCDSCGMDDYLDKPIKVDAFEGAWKRCLEEKNAQQKSEPAESSPDESNTTQSEHQRAPFWDDARLDKLRATMGDEADEFIGDMLAMFLSDVPSQLEALEASIKAADASALREAAHRIKGSSTNIGLIRVSDVGLKLEEMGQTGELDAAMYWFKRLKGLTNQIAVRTREDLGLELPA